MIFTETAIAGVFIVEPKLFPDERGTFVRTWAPDEFAARGLETTIAQISVASNLERGTIRGLHYQRAPVAQAKLVRASRGAAFDVAVDMRADSRTFLKWIGVELSSQNRRMLYLPTGCAHGYQTLVDDTEIAYLISAPYSPPHEEGVRWDDPALAIAWPLGAPTRISARDAAFPDFRLAESSERGASRSR